MKRIAILTFIKSENYGGNLQAFALQKKLCLLGHDVSVLHQLRPINKKFIKSNNFLSIIELRDKLSKRARLNSHISNLISELASIVFHKRNQKRIKRFLDFENKYLNLTQKIFYSFDDLYKEKLQYNIFITGSDQVWNFTKGFSPEPYFLTFAKEGQKKISYAASIGHSIIPEEIQDNYKKWFNNIDYISTREDQAELLVKQISGKPAITVLDPTFLLRKEDWMNILPQKNEINESYLLIYTIFRSPYILNLARKIAKIKKLKIVRIIPDCWTLEHRQKIRNIYDAGPVEFVSLFSNASFVLTNSFHGTAFSINFNIPFFSIPRENAQTKSRFTNILNKTNLSHRLIYDGTIFPKEKDWDLNFSEANKLLDIERNKSINFLITAIGD